MVDSEKMARTGLRMALASSGLALAGLFFSSVSFACQQAQAPGLFKMGLDSAQRVFIGRVLSNAKGVATFGVEHAIRGVSGREAAEKTVEGTCGIDFAPGTRWLFAGPSAKDPSVMLPSSGGFGEVLKRRQEPVEKVPGELLGMQACAFDAQCVTVAYGCSATAVGKGFEDKGRALAQGLWGDPRTLNCAHSRDEASLPAALCVARRCGSWFVDVAAKEGRKGGSK